MIKGKKSNKSVITNCQISFVKSIVMWQSYCIFFHSIGSSSIKAPSYAKLLARKSTRQGLFHNAMLLYKLYHKWNPSAYPTPSKQMFKHFSMSTVVRQAEDWKKILCNGGLVSTWLDKLHPPLRTRMFVHHFAIFSPWIWLCAHSFSPDKEKQKITIQEEKC